MSEGGPAFLSEQSETQEGTWNQTYEPGMSLRDWFAGMAMQAILASNDGRRVIAEIAPEHQIKETVFLAEVSWGIADVMIAKQGN